MRRVLLVLALSGVLLAGAAVGLVRPWAPHPSGEMVAAAWLPVWDERAPESLARALDEGGLAEVSPTWATLRPDGALVETPPSQEVLDRIEDEGARLVPAVQNFADGEWQGEATARLLADPVAAAEHRRQLVEMARENDWDGVDVDYESLPALAGADFTAFLRALRDDLHEHGLVLSVAVPARDRDETTYALAYGYQAIGRIADQVRVMTYDNAWSGSAPGPIAPTAWVRDVVDYAVERIPPEKLMLGMATYGYDWVGEDGRNLQHADAVALAEQVGAQPRWDADAAAWTFDYEDQGQQHTVWFEDARSLETKQRLAAAAGLRGIAIWQLGGEDPRLWAAVAETTGRGVGA